MEDLVNLFLNTGVAIAVIIFFMYRDIKFSSELKTTLQTLVDTVNCLKEMMKMKGEN